VLLGLLSALTLLVAELTRNWSIVAAAVFTGAMAGPLAFAVWLTDRTRIGRSVAPDVLFVTFVVGGCVASIFAGVFVSDFFYRPDAPGWLWISVVEEIAKVLVPLALCGLVPRYRSVERALALAIASAGGFAVIENIAYTAGALDESVDAARRVLFERSAVTPFGHLAWTAIAVIVAARAWVQHQHLLLRPRALWGLALAVALHTAWNLALVEQGWWHLLVIPIAAITFGVLWRLLSDVYYDGPYIAPAEHAHRRGPPPVEDR
jgi:RsiW-degrading membrane proteinase PrsW (M82 family)